LRREKLDQIKQALELGQVLDLDQDSSEEDDESSDDEIIEEKIDEEVDHNNPLEAQYKAELKAEIQGKPYMEKVQPKKEKTGTSSTKDRNCSWIDYDDQEESSFV